MKETNRARWMLIISMAVFGTLGLFVRNISVSSAELALYRAMMAATLIGLFLLSPVVVKLIKDNKEKTHL